MDEAQATLDGLDRWRRSWLLKNTSPRLRYRRQQRGCGVIIWTGIIGNEIVGSFLVPDGLEMNSANYCTFLDENFMP